MVTLKRACELHQSATRKEAVYLMVLVIALDLALACAIALVYAYVDAYGY